MHVCLSMILQRMDDFSHSLWLSKSEQPIAAPPFVPPTRMVVSVASALQVTPCPTLMSIITCICICYRVFMYTCIR